MSDPTPTPAAPSPTPQSVDELPQWAQKEIKDLRTEAAGRRVDNGSLTTQLTEVTGQVQTLTTQVTDTTARAETAESKYLKLSVALQAGVPGEQAVEFAELLQGSNEQELKDYAEKIRKFNGNPLRPGYDPSQGRGGEDNTPLTPEQEFTAMLQKYL